MVKSPLPVRDGLNPSRIRLPVTGPWATVAEHLLERFADDRVRVAEKIALGEVVDVDGSVITASTPYQPDAFVFLYRDPAPERRVPFEIEILHRDDDLLVIDKPHFLATMPRGFYIVESALVRLRRDLGIPELSPAHRLDRVTAGVVVFTLRPEVRGAYQQLFAHRQVVKEYEAVAAVDPRLEFPLTVRSRILKERGTPTAREIPGEPNAESWIDLLDVRPDTDGTGAIGRYRLRPHTGKTHQLRVHMNSLGVPIRNDHFYPELVEVDPYDYSTPLQLVARSIEFTDPLSGRPRRFETQRRLSCWTA
ncbi:RluA family pseudouridine synthase [Nakamurella leprariae]|uniref:RNA pseudouridylate synthase n=1 Tax=Nakamurella leprariae TaxID=2803911 RepID=A0A938YAM4_9ACTN|nr:RluA family pseudouridine synthase [Nakamurella leprariae]MBM9466123.1 RluA family pseudouridine synthase [Nakamurella leprariae]